MVQRFRREVLDERSVQQRAGEQASIADLARDLDRFLIRRQHVLLITLPVHDAAECAQAPGTDGVAALSFRSIEHALEPRSPFRQAAPLLPEPPDGPGDAEAVLDVLRTQGPDRHDRGRPACCRVPVRGSPATSPGARWSGTVRPPPPGRGNTPSAPVRARDVPVRRRPRAGRPRYSRIVPSIVNRRVPSTSWDRRTRLASTSSARPSSTSRSSPQIASASSRVHPPANTDRRAKRRCSRGPNSS